MHPDATLSKGIQRGPPNMFNLPDMFREIADSVNRSFHRFRAYLARRRQGTNPHSLSRPYVPWCDIGSILTTLACTGSRRAPKEQAVTMARRQQLNLAVGDPR
jgi:hypothetical protein